MLDFIYKSFQFSFLLNRILLILNLFYNGQIYNVG